MDWQGMSVFERVAHIASNADRIFIRSHMDGHWQSLALSSLPDDLKFIELRRLAEQYDPPVVAQLS